MTIENIVIHVILASFLAPIIIRTISFNHERKELASKIANCKWKLYRQNRELRALRAIYRIDGKINFDSVLVEQIYHELPIPISNPEYKPTRRMFGYRLFVSSKPMPHFDPAYVYESIRVNGTFDLSEYITNSLDDEIIGLFAYRVIRDLERTSIDCEAIKEIRNALIQIIKIEVNKRKLKGEYSEEKLDFMRFVAEQITEDENKTYSIR